MILKLGMTPLQVAGRFRWLDQESMESYRDATYSRPDFRLRLVDCWRGLHKGKELGWVRYGGDTCKWGAIDLDEYVQYDNPANGNLHEVVPGKFIAFQGPEDLGGADYRDDARGGRAFSPAFYAEILLEMGARAVVRLNEPRYEACELTSRGFAHHSLEFEDCTCPPDTVVEAFLRAVDAAEGVVAVHCKAGLGRTGTLIALWLMRSERFTAREAMGWLRIMRPGSVIGEQQHYLCAVDAAFRRFLGRPASLPRAPLTHRPRTHLKQDLGVVGRAEDASAARVVTVVGAAEVLGSLEGDELARHHLVKTAIHGIVVLHILVKVDRSPLVFVAAVAHPPVFLALVEAPPAVDEVQLEVWMRVGRVAIGLDGTLIEPPESRFNLGRGHVELEDHVGSDEENCVGKRPTSLLRVDHDLGAWKGGQLRVQTPDEADGGRHVHRAEVITVRVVAQELRKMNASEVTLHGCILELMSQKHHIPDDLMENSHHIRGSFQNRQVYINNNLTSMIHFFFKIFAVCILNYTKQRG